MHYGEAGVMQHADGETARLGVTDNNVLVIGNARWRDTVGYYWRVLCVSPCRSTTSSLMMASAVTLSEI